VDGEGYKIGNGGKMSFRPTHHPEEQHTDHLVASYGIESLQKKHDKPFFFSGWYRKASFTI